MKNNRPKYYQIIDAAVKVFAENGFHGSQVSKIAKAAGVADGTIYLYFKNKEDILITMFKEKMGQFIDRTVHQINQKKNANEKLLTLIEMHFTQLSEDRNLAIVTQLELRQSNYELRYEINSVLKPYLT
ncbi:TetR/AcrR family transcriptional regulator, partial [Oceanobacillus caeni]